MVSFTLSASIALLASIASVTAAPFASDASTPLVARQATLPPDCSQYCSVAAGCVCIKRPTNCVATYLVGDDENCGTVVSRFNNFTATDLYAWNPEIGTSCFGITSHVPVCIGVTGYVYPGPVKAGDKRTPAQIPVPVQPGILPNCTQFEYTDSSGNPGFQSILAENSITQGQWNTWNYPTQNATQDWSIWAQYFSCVKA